MQTNIKYLLQSSEREINACGVRTKALSVSEQRTLTKNSVSHELIISAWVPYEFYNFNLYDATLKRVNTNKKFIPVMAKILSLLCKNSEKSKHIFGGVSQK